MRRNPLAGVRVLDFSTLLPGPLCTLLLAEAGAQVVKVERPGHGDEMRKNKVRPEADSIIFSNLNRDKRSVRLDLKKKGDVQVAIKLAAESDVVVEQFRPGVMKRLGLDYESLSKVNPRLVYCSITGFGQTGPMSELAAHDLNYQAETGMLGLSAGSDGTPGLPQALIADIGGGAYPAVMNILLALRQRESDGRGAYLDISMSDNLFTFMFWGLANGFSGEGWPVPGKERVTGGLPRYQVYRTLDDKYLAAAPLEQKFWANFVNTLGAPELVDDGVHPAATREAVARIIATQTADHWEARFAGVDACVNVVRSLEEAVNNPQFRMRGLFDSLTETVEGQSVPALPVPIVERLRRQSKTGQGPKLGEADDEIIGAFR